MTNKTYQTSLIALLIASSLFGQDIVWEREYKCMVDGQLMVNAYSGGDAYVWLRPTLIDIDNDGDFDLFVGKGGEWGEGTGTIDFYKNNGNNTNPNWVLITDRYGSIYVRGSAAPSFCDIDADGDYDLFIGNGAAGSWGGTVVYYKNIGTADAASWQWETDSLASIDVGDNSIPTFADIDSDGDFDLFVGGGYGKIAFYRNIGDSQVATWDSVTTNYNSIHVGWKSTPTFVDIDDDNDLDLFIGEDNGNLNFYRNDGTPTEATWTYVKSNYAHIDFGWLDYTAPTFADIDNDGDVDLFLSEHFGNINFYCNTGDQKNPDWFWETGNYISSTIDIGMNSTPTFADIDDDGDFDMFIGKANGQIRFFLNNGNSEEPNWCLEAENYNSIDVGGYAIPTLCDIDNDNDFDLFIGSENGNIKFYQNDGSSSLAEWTLVNEQYNSIDVDQFAAPSFCDIDADDDFDLFVGNSDGTIYYYENIGRPDSVVWSYITNMYDSVDVLSRSKPIFIDIDFDSDFDMFIGNHYGSLHFYRNDGDSSLARFTFITDDYNSIDVGSCNSPSFVDIDADSDIDLFIGVEDGGINFWRNIGSNVNVEHSTNLNLPNTPKLYQNHPNPFNPSTKISYSISKLEFVTLKIYNIIGREIQTLVNEYQISNNYTVNFDASKLPTGIYFYKLQVGDNFVKTKKMLLIQ